MGIVPEANRRGKRGAGAAQREIYRGVRLQANMDASWEIGNGYDKLNKLRATNLTTQFHHHHISISYISQLPRLEEA